MTHQYAQIAFTSDVQTLQAQFGSAEQNQRLLRHAGPNDQLGTRESEFITQRDTFYIATVSESGWPYVQHRGGPVGVLQVINPTLLAYADYRGNAQLITAGNALGNNRCSLLLIDYANRKRLKIIGHQKVVDARNDEDQLQRQFTVPDYMASIERIVTIEVIGYDWNCPQHITPRFTAAEAEQLSNQL